MGAAASNPFDEAARTELNGIIKETIGEFTIQYTISLAANLVKKAEAELEAKDKKEEPKPDRQLQTDAEPPKDVRKEGYLIKQGLIRKNWLTRYFTINPDYSISYKVKKEDAKEKGKFTLGGYWVHDWRDAPKDKPFTIHGEHYYKRQWYFQVPPPEEKDVKHEDHYEKWKDALRAAARNAPSPLTTDPLLRRVYARAYLKTYEKYWWWSSYFYGWGSEVELISDLIYRRIRWGLLWRVKSKVKGPAAIANKVKDQIDGAVKTTVLAACDAGWKALVTTRDGLMPKMEATIKEQGGPLFEQKKKLKDAINDKLMEIIKPILEKTAQPIVEKVLDKALTPIADAHVETLKGFKRCIDWCCNSGSSKEFKDTDVRRMRGWSYWYNWESRQIMWKMESDDMVKKALTPPSSGAGEASGAGEGKEEESNANIAYTINDALQAQMEDAFFTLGKDKDIKVVGGKFLNDSKIVLRDQYRSFILGVLKPNIFALAAKSILELVKPLDDALPEAFKQFLNGHDTCVEIIDRICNETADILLKAAYDSNVQKMEAAMQQVIGSW